MSTVANDVVAERIQICTSCPELNRLKMCKKCGCFMPVKIRLKSSSCPIGKWDKTGTEEYDKSINLDSKIESGEIKF